MPKGQQQKRNHKKSTKKEVETLPEKLVEFLNTLPTRAKKGSNAKQDIKRIIKLYNKRCDENLFDLNHIIRPYLYHDEWRGASSWEDLITNGIRPGPPPLVPLYTENGIYIGEPDDNIPS